MQVKKNEVENRIVMAGKQLFMKHGFRNTSMRQIAKLSEISTANIYNYFKNKNELFQCIVIEAIEVYEKFLIESYSNEVFENERSWTIEGEIEICNDFIDILYDYKNEFILLLSKSEGSKFENYEIKMIEMQCKLSQKTNEYIDKGEKTFLRKKIPEFITRNTAKMYMEIIMEGLCSNLNKEEVKERVKECIFFLFYGYTVYFSDNLQKK